MKPAFLQKPNQWCGHTFEDELPIVLAGVALNAARELIDSFY
jgi:hypothetical protein